MTYSNILIAVDGSECSMNAAKKGIELAKDLSANVVMVCAVDMRDMIDTAAVGAIIDSETESVYHNEALNILDKILKKHPYNKVTKVTEEGIPQEVINVIAKKHKADLIIMGTHGRKGLNHLVMGSVAEHVLRYSNIPVLIVPSSEA